MKLLFTDLDGTLLNDQSEVTTYTKAFIEKFLSAGNKLILSSGRPFHSVLEVVDNAGLSKKGLLLICSNGTLIYDFDQNKPIFEKRLPLSYVAYLQKKANEHHLHIQTYTDDAVVSAKEDEEIRFYRQKIHLPLILAKDYASFLSKEPYKMLAAHLTDHEKLEAFRLDIAPWAEGKIQTVFSNAMYLELFDHTAGKGNAVTYVCEYFHVPISDSYAAGDADNDISMLQAAGCGIAMKNASEQVKKSADCITDFTNDNDGLARFMEKILV